MASSNRLGNLTPFKVWLSFVALMLGLLVLTSSVFFKKAQEENKSLLEAQMNTLIKSGYKDLSSKKYREFVEGLSNMNVFSFISISHLDIEFSVGKMEPKDICVKKTIDIRSDSSVAELRFCKADTSDFFLFAIVGFIFIGFSILILLFVKNLESNLLSSITQRLQKVGIKLSKNETSFSSLLKDIGNLNSELEAYQEEAIESARRESSLKAKEQISKQVAHDIRSPLSALDILVKTKLDIPQNKLELLTASVARIKEISDDLVDSSLANKAIEPVKSSVVLRDIEILVAEKSLEYPAAKIVYLQTNPDEVLHFIKVRLISSELKRILSNLINNSMEAIPDQLTPKIEIVATINEGELSIVVSDNGPGIPSEQLNSVFEKGFTFGKATGSGLGLFHAKQCLESWGGEIKLLETGSSGTRLLLTLK